MKMIQHLQICYILLALLEFEVLERNICFQSQLYNCDLIKIILLFLKLIEQKMDNSYEDQAETIQVAGFIAKTFQILNNQQYSRIVYWSPAGTEFIIKDINKFQQVVLPKYFRHNKINSFIRQLNMYGFHKSRKEHSKSVFSHPLFQKNREDLLCQIKRKIKQNEGQTHEPEVKFETPVKTQKVFKEQLQTAVTGRQLPLSKEKILPPSKNSTILDGFIGSSFIKLFQSKQMFSKQQLNFSMIKMSQNCLGQVRFQDDRKDEIISIEDGIQEKQERQRQMNFLPSIARFQNPTCFFNSSILKD